MTCHYCGLPECTCGRQKTRYEDATIVQALTILDGRLKKHDGQTMYPQDAKNFLMLKLGLLEHEEFGCMFLDICHKLLEFKVLGIGTLTQSAIYPREVIKAALAANAAYVILAHNHPHGNTAPSESDIELTHTLEKTLALVDVKVIDHMIVAGNEVYSMLDNDQMLLEPS